MSQLRFVQRAKPLLPERWYRAIRDAYWEEFWKSELRQQQAEIGERAAESLVGSERALLAEAIGDFYPFASLLEVGCSYGQLFHIIAKQYPRVRMIGLDNDADRIAGGKPLLQRFGLMNVELRWGEAEALQEIQSESFDLLVTSAALLYVPPDKIERAMEEFHRVAKKGLLFLELHVDDPNGSLGIPGPCLLGEPDYWLRDYRRLLEKFYSKDQIEITKVPNPRWQTENWQYSGHLITVRV